MGKNYLGQNPHRDAFQLVQIVWWKLAEREVCVARSGNAVLVYGRVYFLFFLFNFFVLQSKDGRLLQLSTSTAALFFINSVSHEFDGFNK
ncbi:hypothetical protein T12_13215 [Trichinella patagoniensis]|uniref:Uncharacterized protein n=1 Tax=Trichinella patagoniensis TaxID=990121 RepID=A0A0V1ADJ4_9BILA|nr:hypothetical protein T12_13215 [Trichinella patagoniensis]